MNHLTDEQLSGYLDGAFKGRDAEGAGRHIASCQPCREALAELAAQDQLLKPALTHDPGEAYFKRFASRVAERIGAAGASRPRPRGAFDLGRFFRSPRALAWAGGVAVVVVGGGLALMTGREVLPPDLRDRDLATRVERATPDEAKQIEPGETRQAAPPVAPPAEKDGPFAHPPGEARVRADALAPAPQAAPPPSPAPVDARLASPGRAMEVRRNEAGEEVPVRRQGERRAAPPPSPNAAGGADQAAQVRKKLAAEPLDAVKKSPPTQTLGATGAAGESAALEYSFAPPPRGTVTPGMARQAAPVRGAEGEGWLCGDVRDAADRPIAGAQVVLTDLGRTATTDALGRFCMRVPRGEHPLSVMAVGYTVSRQRVRAEGADSNVRVTLAAVSVLDEQRTTIKGRAAPRRVPVAPPSAPLGEPRGSYSALSDTLRRMVGEARRLEADAAARRSAMHYDMAARAWERALSRLTEGPLAMETRRNLAEARYHAWEMGPNSRRALAAVEALTAFASRAPAGPERDQATRWLDRVRP